MKYRQDQPHGSYERYVQHLREKSQPCELCNAARRMRNHLARQARHQSRPAGSAHRAPADPAS
jgi:hypothetical protein